MRLHLRAECRRGASYRVPENVRPQLQADGTPETTHLVRMWRRAQVQMSRVPAQVRIQLQHEEAHGPRAQRNEGYAIMAAEFL